MAVSRRNALRKIGATAFAGAALPWLGSSHHAVLVNSLTSEERTGPIRLDKNENPYGPSAKAVAAMQEALGYAHRYPDGDALREKIAILHKVKPQQVVLGCGSSEILSMACDAFLSADKKLVLASPTYGLMAQYAARKGAQVSAVPLTPRFEHDLQAMLAHSGPATGLAYICNPNNPTGSLTPRHGLEEFLLKLPPDIPVVMDEAYHHYVGATGPFYTSFIERPVDDKRLIVVRTFSKIFGLAGARIGYAVASPEIAARLSQRRVQFGENTIGLAAAMAALDDTEHLQTSLKRNGDERQEFFNRAIFIHLRMVDSHTNFVLLNTYRPAEEVIDFFRAKNILLGPPVPSMKTYVRISMGLPEEMREFWRVLALMPPIPGGHH